ncbi:adaptive-response sensory-kinase SasA [mine drainage metagenome]|uniref:histidine kinase n=1 Tax=mine drainage metagenome TaxID=410659 RepID=A0A1J5SLA2_9ZZZZ
MPASFNIFRRTFNNTDSLMALMILSLHTLLTLGETKQLYPALFLCHYGLFLLWQPVMRQSKSLSWRAVLMIIAGAAFAMFYINWWGIAFWIAGLFSLIGGRVFATEPTSSKLPKMLAATYLLSVLLLWVVPNLLQVKDDLAATELLVTYVLPLLPLAILFLSTKNKPDNQTPNLDFFYTLLLFLLTLIVILGSFALGIIWKIQYIQLLAITVFSLAAILVAISWLWNPSASFSGLELLMSRYLLSLGLPFELWIRKISEYLESEKTAENFMHAAILELATLNWVSGLSWETANSNQHTGKTTPYISHFSFEQLQLTLYSHWELSPAMYLHAQLLTQILSEFYVAKRREETVSQNTYMQSLYETGSRLTHDIKNILQSLGTLSAAAALSKDTNDDAKLVELIKKQLPRLSQRLSSTLNKLEQPSMEKKHQLLIASWWQHFKQLNTSNQVQFDAPENFPKTNIDADMMDSIADNLLQNALEKAKQEADIKIKVTLCNTPHFCLDVTDTGSAIPEMIAARLFKSHINSDNGLGVGLYHAAQQATQSGFQLSLVENRSGEVRFRLEALPIDNLSAN